MGEKRSACTFWVGMSGGALSRRDGSTNIDFKSSSMARRGPNKSVRVKGKLWDPLNSIEP
jgi:hypothetical protein